VVLLNFKKYIEEFKEIPEILSIIIIPDINAKDNFEFYSRMNLNIAKLVNSLIYRVKKKIYDLSMENFYLSDKDKIIIGIKEENTILIIIAEDKVDLEIINNIIQKFLNELLISI